MTVRLPEDLGAALDDASRRLDRKHSEVVRMALRAFLGLDRDAADRNARVAHLFGSLESGRPDLADRHREVVLESLQRER